jgi:hypothetical protein
MEADGGDGGSAFACRFGATTSTLSSQLVSGFQLALFWLAKIAFKPADSTLDGGCNRIPLTGATKRRFGSN